MFQPSKIMTVIIEITGFSKISGDLKIIKFVLQYKYDLV